ncbi:uncharacterized protein F5147DRAFT_293884 [Suillus discolor]|uniref:Uncharacterized protein n=1 Tax=Suillus discolor TaxID=1912936 RepID=A0A9P7JR68_9AGAM|nr:uncharacterized protein F5147DRAFT_293884 [Suillus discolor]KAG2102272.1 hypothetical protein F5147DRAFT_293884 [Suillus discolor]
MFGMNAEEKDVFKVLLFLSLLFAPCINIVPIYLIHMTFMFCRVCTFVDAVGLLLVRVRRLRLMKRSPPLPRAQHFAELTHRGHWHRICLKVALCHALHRG